MQYLTLINKLTKEATIAIKGIFKHSNLMNFSLAKEKAIISEEQVRDASRKFGDFNSMYFSFPLSIKFGRGLQLPK